MIHKHEELHSAGRTQLQLSYPHFTDMVIIEQTLRKRLPVLLAVKIVLYKEKKRKKEDLPEQPPGYAITNSKSKFICLTTSGHRRMHNCDAVDPFTHTGLQTQQLLMDTCSKVCNSIPHLHACNSTLLLLPPLQTGQPQSLDFSDKVLCTSNRKHRKTKIPYTPSIHFQSLFRILL